MGIFRGPLAIHGSYFGNHGPKEYMYFDLHILCITLHKSTLSQK